jgi:hypothetical protein
MGVAGEADAERPRPMGVAGEADAERAGPTGAAIRAAERERDGDIAKFDMWAIRVFGSVAALAFISLLVMIAKALFVF